jgi:hypothetical protein
MLSVIMRSAEQRVPLKGLRVEGVVFVVEGFVV